MTKQEPVEGRQRETKEGRPGSDVVTKSVSLQELRTLSAEAVWGKRETNGDRPGHHVGIGSSRRETKGNEWRHTWKLYWNRIQ